MLSCDQVPGMDLTSRTYAQVTKMILKATQNAEAVTRTPLLSAMEHTDITFMNGKCARVNSATSNAGLHISTYTTF